MLALHGNARRVAEGRYGLLDRDRAKTKRQIDSETLPSAETNPSVQQGSHRIPISRLHPPQAQGELEQKRPRLLVPNFLKILCM
jgi:hypothetical protein